VVFSFLIGYLLKAIYPIIFGIVVIPTWWVSQSVLWVENKDIRSYAILSGFYLIIFIFYLLGRFHENRERYERVSTTFNLISVTMLSTFLFIISTPYGISLLEGNMAEGSIFLSLPFTFFLALFFIISVLLVIYTKKSKVLLNIEFLPLFFLFLVFVIFIFIKIPALTEFHSGQYYYYPHWKNLTHKGIIAAIFLNAVAFLQMFWLLFLGYYRREKVLINLGVFFLFFFIIFKYFSIFNFLNKSIFFLGAGILLFIAGYFMEKGRKFYLEKIYK